MRSCWFDKSHAYEACLYRQPFKYQLSMQQAKAHKNRYEQSSFSHPEVSFGISECSYYLFCLAACFQKGLNCLPAEDGVWWKPYDVHFIRLTSTASFDPTPWRSFESQKVEDDGGSRVGASKLFWLWWLWPLGFLSVAVPTLQQQTHPIHSEVQEKFGFPNRAAGGRGVGHLFSKRICNGYSCYSSYSSSSSSPKIPKEHGRQTSDQYRKERGKAQATRPNSQSSRGERRTDSATNKNMNT